LSSSAFATIERNFSMWKVRPCRPTRSCLKRMGPREVSFTRAAAARSRGDRAASAAAEAVMSNRRFMNHCSGFACTLRKCAYPSALAPTRASLARVRR
jgi:hypothetical protein